ncbi:MAG TPA: hypothetical protein VKR05_01940 [Candidatus Cybelea sp.]|nr:hypothetical protein [Candidatus Cybelea sp.]
MNLRFACVAAAIVLMGTSSAQLDSQYVLQRYALAIDTVPVPKAMAFTYTVSQAGPNNIEQRHVMYRSGSDVRDETLAVDGVSLQKKIVRFSKRDDRYAIATLAPRTAAYQLLFIKTLRDGRHVDYVYEATSLLHTSASAASIDRVSIDGSTYLPRVLYFTTSAEGAKGTGRIEYAAFGKYWMPVIAEIDAKVNGKPARERIVWSDYSFFDSLPASTFQPPKPLPVATLPPI